MAYFAGPQMESILLRRLEQLQSLGDASPLGLAQSLRASLQAHSSTGGLEWSSSDGSDEGQQEQVKMDVADGELAPQLDAWQSWLAANCVEVGKPQYCALAHALVQAILSAVLPGSAEPAVQLAALEAAWEEDSAGSGAVSSDRMKASLAALATACCSDGSPTTAAACLGGLLGQLQGQGERWRALVATYEAAPGIVAADGKVAAAEGGGGKGNESESDDDLDDLLGEEDDDGGNGKPDVAPASDKTTDAATGEPAAAPDDDDDDDTSSLGLSRAESHVSAKPAVAAVPASKGGAPKVDASRQDSSKSLGGRSIGALSRALSAASSEGLDDMPDNLDAMEVRQATHAHASSGQPRNKPLLAGLMASEEGMGAMASMPTDLRNWAAFKDKQPGAAAGPPPGRAPPGAGRGAGGGKAAPAAGHLAPLGGSRQTLDQHLKGKRSGDAGPGPAPPLLSSRNDGPKANPMHHALNSSAARQSMDRAAHFLPQQPQGSGSSGIFGNTAISRNASNGSGGANPAGRQRSLNSHLSRKPSVSEPGPSGPQAEWRQLPALGHGVRLHPAELRQPSHGGISCGMTGAGGKTGSGGALIEDKLPSLPSLMGARGQPSMMRKPSRGALQYDSPHHPPHGQGGGLPGLGAGRGAQGSRAMRMPSKKSFKGDRDF